MMDIAEIRKKAKARETSATLEKVAETGQSSTDSFIEPWSPAAPGEFEQAESRYLPVADSKTSAAATSGGYDKLDRLFAAVDTSSFGDLGLGSDSAGELLDLEDSVFSQYLTFHLSDEEYALDIARISEIIKVRELTEVPRCPAFVLGVISLRGVIVPVYDLCQRLKLGVADLQAVSRIIVCKEADLTVGFLVDSINQVVTLAESELEPPPGILTGLDRDMVAAVGRYEGRMLILLNLQSVLDFDSV